MDDPYAHLEDNAWREQAELDARLARGQIDEAAWHRAMEEVLLPAYLAPGRSERVNLRKPGMEYRVLWLDA